MHIWIQYSLTLLCLSLSCHGLSGPDFRAKCRDSRYFLYEGKCYRRLPDGPRVSLCTKYYTFEQPACTFTYTYESARTKILRLPNLRTLRALIFKSYYLIKIWISHALPYDCFVYLFYDFFYHYHKTLM